MGRYVPKEIRKGKGKVLEVMPTKKGSGGAVEVVDGDEEVVRAEIRKRVGLTYEQLCQTVRDGLVAETAIVNGEGNVVRTVPANSERAKFVAVAAEILGAKKPEAAAQRVPSIVIITSDGRRI